MAILFLIGLDIIASIKIWPLMSVIIVSAIIPSILEIINRIIYKKEGESGQRTFYKSISGVKASIIRALLEIGTLPDKAYTMVKAIAKTLYRLLISKKHLLEWTTAEEAEKNSKTDIVSYYKNMWPNLVLGVILLLLSYANPWVIILSLGWIITPSVMKLISKKEKYTPAIEYLSQKDKEYMLEIGRRTWSYFKENLTEKSNFLPPDNYQEDRKEQLIYRTSPTNIGLALLAVVSSYDLGYENLEDTISLLSKMIEIIAKLQKWNGHLYNWYDLTTLEPLSPKYVSTVDSGNFIGYLYTLKQFLQDILKEIGEGKINQLIANRRKEAEFIQTKKNKEGANENGENNNFTNVQSVESDKEKEEQTASEDKKYNINDEEIKKYETNKKDKQDLTETINYMINIIDNTIDGTDFRYLYSEENRIFSIGFNVEDNFNSFIL